MNLEDEISVREQIAALFDAFFSLTDKEQTESMDDLIEDVSMTLLGEILYADDMEGDLFDIVYESIKIADLGRTKEAIDHVIKDFSILIEKRQATCSHPRWACEVIDIDNEREVGVVACRRCGLDFYENMGGERNN
jgi:hypothetical protein